MGRHWGRSRVLRAAGAIVAGTLAAIAVAAPAQAADDEHDEHRLHTVLQLTDEIAMDSARYVFENSGGWTVDGAPSGTEFLAWTAESDLLAPPIQATMVAHVVENGLSTPFWVRVVSARNYSEGATFYDAGCDVFRGDPDVGGTLLDPAEGSPYTCEKTGIQYDPGEGNITTLTVTISSLIWTTARGIVAPQSGVTLTNGTFETSAPHTFIDDMPQAVAALPRELGFPDQLTWASSARNGESTAPARAEFTYDIQGSGGYTVTGWASTAKDGAYFDHGADCDILHDGQPVASPPFRCQVDGLDLASGGDWQAVFRVSRVTGTDVGVIEPTPTPPGSTPPAASIPPSGGSDADAHPATAPAASLAASGSDASPQATIILGTAAVLLGAGVLIVSGRRARRRASRVRGG